VPKGHFSIEPLGDSALLLQYGDGIDAVVHENLLHDWKILEKAASQVIRELIPAYTTLGVIYDLQKAHQLPGEGDPYTKVCRLVTGLLTDNNEHQQQFKPREISVPVCYESVYAPDLAWAAELKGLSTEAFIRIHSSVSYRVYMLGFLPGFAYMGEVDESIVLPRKDTPRTVVPKGSVGIAGKQTGIYPTDSPGGWQLIGRTPIRLFDPEAANPGFFQPGDIVRFYSIKADEFENY
jgi:inhibitor of KinA